MHVKLPGCPVPSLGPARSMCLGTDGVAKTDRLTGLCLEGGGLEPALFGGSGNFWLGGRTGEGCDPHLLRSLVLCCA